jgi:hypothetical protein
MRKKLATVAGLGLVVVVIAVLVIWPSLRAKSTEPTRRDSSVQPAPERQTPDVRVQTSQNESTREEEKGTPALEEKPRGRVKGADGIELPFASATWVMEQQRIDPNGMVKENSISRVWVKGDQKRVETFRTLGAWSGTAQQPVIILIADKDYEYAYNPSLGRILKFPRNLSLDALSDKMVKKRSERKVGSEIVDGKTCKTYRLVNDVNVAGLATVKMEVKESRWQGMVLKSVSKTMGSKTADTLVTQLKDVHLDVEIPDEKFVLPAGVQIQEVKIPPKAALEKSLR